MATLNNSCTPSSCRPHRDLARHLNVSNVAETVNSAFEVEWQQPLRTHRSLPGCWLETGSGRSLFRSG